MVYPIDSLMSRTVIDIDRVALEGARRALGTATVRDTVNAALRNVVEQRRRLQLAALDEYPGDAIDEFIAWRRERDQRPTQP